MWLGALSGSVRRRQSVRHASHFAKPLSHALANRGNPSYFRLVGLRGVLGALERWVWAATQACKSPFAPHFRYICALISYCLVAQLHAASSASSIRRHNHIRGLEQFICHMRGRPPVHPPYAYQPVSDLIRLLSKVWLGRGSSQMQRRINCQCGDWGGGRRWKNHEAGSDVDGYGA